MKKETSEEPQILETEAVTAQESVLPKVGETLKRTRESKKIKLSAIAQALCIRQSYLEAIENNDYENIPEPPYGIGFIRSYAEYLGLNGAQMVQFFKNEASEKSSESVVFSAEDQTETGAPGKKYLLLALLAVFAVYFGWSLMNDYDSENNEETVPAETATVSENNELPLVVEEYSVNLPETEQPAAIVEELPVIEPEENAQASDNQVTMTEDSFEEKSVEKTTATQEKKIEKKAEKKEVEKKAPVSEDKPDSRVVLKITKETWVEVKDGTKLYLSKVLQPGAIYAIPNGQGMILSVGKNDGVEVWVDGKQTEVVTPTKKMNIEVDKFLSAQH